MAELTTQSFVDYIKKVEGFSPTLYDDVGTPAIGYGYRPKPGEDFSAGVTEEEASRLLLGSLKDAIPASRAAARELDEGADFDSMSRPQQFKLMDRAMNMGSTFHHEETAYGAQGFPKWAGHVLSGNIEGELEEYERFSNGKPMTARNQAYLDYFHSGRDADSREATKQVSNESVSRLAVEDGGQEEGAGSPQPSSMQQLVTSGEFQGLSPEQRVQRLADEYPDFQKLHEVDPARAAAFVGRMMDQGEIEDPSFWSSMKGGFRVGVGTAAWTMSNLAMLIEKAGIENDYDESWRKFADVQFIDGGKMIGSDWYDFVGSVVAGLPGGLAIPGLATLGAGALLPAGATALAPAIGFGLTGAVSAADEGPEAAAKRGATDAALGFIYPATAHLRRMSRIAIESGAAYAVNEQEDETRRGIESVTMGIIAGLPGKRPPYAIMQRLGVKNPEALTRTANAEAARQQRSNAQTAANLEGGLTHDAYGNKITNLGDAMRAYGEIVKNEHPMTMRPMDRTPHERQAIETRQRDSATDANPITRDVAPDRKSARFAPGPEWVEHRAFTVAEDNASRIIKGYKKAGEVITPLATAFEIPVHAGPGQAKLGKTARGWYQYLSRGADGKEINPQRLQVRDRPNVQTTAHELGHHFAFKDPSLAKLHDSRLKSVRDDLDRIDEIARANDVGPQESVNAEGKPDTQFSGIMVDQNGKATVSGIFKLHKEGKIPKDLQRIPELLSVSYDRDNLGEGVAEMFRLWMTNNKKFGGEVDLASKFPSSMVELEKWLESRPKHQKKAFERFQKDAHEHLGMNGAAAIGSIMGPDMDASGVLSSKAMLWRQNFFDDNSGLLNLEQRTFGGRQIPDSIYETFRLLRGVAEATQRMVEWGAPVFVVDKNGGRMIRYKGKGLRDILTPVAGNSGQLDRFFRYATARQGLELKLQYRDADGRVRDIHDLDQLKNNPELARRSREKLMSREMIEDAMKLADDHPEYRQVFKELQSFASKMADFGQHAGLWSGAQRASWRRTQFIFSFFRDMEARGRTGVRSASILTGETPTRTLAGSTRNLRDPFQNLLETHARTMRLGLENIAKQELVRFVKTAEGGGRFGEILKPIPNLKGLRLDDIRDAARTEIRKQYPGLDDVQIKNMLDENFPDTGDLEKITMFLGNTKPHGENVMTVFVGGKPKYFDIQDPTLIQSINSMRRPQLVGVQKMWNNLRRFKQYFITIAPGFIAANFARDVAMASIMSKTGGVHLGKAMRGMWGAIRKDQDFQDFHANGGGSAGIRETPAQTRAKVIAHAQRTGFNPKRLLIDSLSVVKALDAIGRTVEVSSRLGEYKAARKQGARAKHAAYLGREVSTDFAVRGENATMGFLGNTIPFFNAMVAGGDRLYRSVRYDPSHKLATAAKIGGVAMSSMALYLVNRENAEYMDLPDWDKWGYWHFFIPKYDEQGNRMRNTEGNFAGQKAYEHYKMQKLWEVGSIGSLGERFLQSLMDGEDETEIDLAQDVAHIIGQNAGLNLFDRGFPLPIPVGLDVVGEQLSNRILYTGNPIESASMTNLESWQRRRAQSPRVFGEYGRLMRTVPSPDLVKSPARAEALLRGVFGEFAMIGANLADSIFFPGGLAKRPDQRPVVSRFYEGTGKYSRQEKEFYERLESFKQANGTLRQMASNPRDAKDLDSWISDPQKQAAIALVQQLQRTQTQIATLTEYQGQLADGLIPVTPEEAERQVRELTQQKRMLMKISTDLAKEIERGR